MTPEQLATLLAKAVPEMQWTVDSEIVRGAPAPIEAHALTDRIMLVRDGQIFAVMLLHGPPRRERPTRAVRDDIARCVGDLLSEEDCTSWAVPLHARAEVLRAERTVTERGAAMKNAIEAYNDAVSALRSAQAHLEAVQDG